MSRKIVNHPASFRHGVRWIALNDNDGAGHCRDTIAGYISTLLLADLFGADPDAVAEAIWRERVKAGLPVGTDHLSEDELAREFG